jgi:Eukaryotic-type carbonic anhydrase
LLLFPLFVLTFLQLGSVAIFFVNGTTADHYDFLELYLREWAKKALKVQSDCNLRAKKQQAKMTAVTATTTTTTTAMLGTMLETATLENDNDDSWTADDDYVNDETLDQGWRDLLKESIDVDAYGDLPLRHDFEHEEKDVDSDNAADEDKDEQERRDLSGQHIFLRRTRRPTRAPSPTTSSMPSSSPSLALQVLNFPYFNRLWHPYDWVDACKTEYYFQYLGSLVEPPCFVGVHWRIMRRPIRISPRQLRIISNLVAKRQDPITCKINSTVGKPRNDGTKWVDVNRPIQMLQGRHDLAFCECVDWNSSLIEDKTYCMQTMEQRGVYPRKDPP